MAKPVKRVREIVKTPDNHEPEEVYDDDQVINDADDDLTEAVTTAALALPPGPISTERKMTHKMPQSGKTIGGSKLSHDKTGAVSTKLTDLGKEWPRKQKNTGGQEAAGGAGLMKGTKKEDYTPETIAGLIEDEFTPMQNIFNTYANQANYICLFEFNEVINAYGYPSVDERTVTNLMANNRSFMFSEQSDARGKYWLIAEMQGACSDCQCDPCECEKCEECNKCPCTCPKESAPPRPGMGQGGPPKPTKCQECKAYPCTCPEEEENGKSKKPWEENIDTIVNTIAERYRDYEVEDQFAEPEFDDEDYTDEELDRLAELGQDMGQGDKGHGDIDHSEEAGPPHGTTEGQYQDCPECGNMLDDLGCPECGWSDQESAMATAVPEGPSRHTEFRGPYESKKQNGRTLSESDNVAMSGPTGKGVAERTGKTGKDSGLPKTKTDTQEMGKEWPRKQKNTGGSWEETGQTKHAEASDGYQKDMMKMGLGEKQKNTGGSWQQFEDGGAGTLKGGAKQMYENVSRLAKHVQETLKEYAKESRLAKGCYQVSFAVSSGNTVKPKVSAQLMEAMTDVEELLQVNTPEQISLEARFCNSEGRIVAKQLIPLIQVSSRGPIVAEGRILFRFPEIARDFADILVSEGKTCRAITDNWGAAVTAKIPMSMALSAYQTIKEATVPNPRDRLRGLLAQVLREMKTTDIGTYKKLSELLEREGEEKILEQLQQKFANLEAMPTKDDVESFLMGHNFEPKKQGMSPEEQEEHFGSEPGTFGR